ncbi:hypothetical protein FRB94_010254 [Tulasnella sp. JGI-2019a]|nr:hypothetical protein FRB94_010254 [Tulasnella sp. JGI-2019a]KAG9012377.1 hypothetical protein FRB93_001800 [Tulasnella sp. JGI-2019a]KAG9036123.1 hypothetical protein FRB95_009696 [Tulasnella sp. JGI-2019a]
MPDSSNTSRERDQSRICVDHVDDWGKVKQNFTEAMTNALDGKLGAANPADREAILAHLMQWKDRTFELAKPNIRVNGINMEDYEDDDDDSVFEPYDEALDLRLWLHSAEVLNWEEVLVTRRRREPKNAQGLVEDLILRQRKLEAEDNPPLLDLGVPSKDGEAPLPPRFEVVTDLHQKSLVMLEDWNETAPKLLERVQQVEAVMSVDSRLVP